MMKRVIAISGLPCSGSTTTASMLSEKLNLDYFSIGLVWKDIARGRVKEKFYYQELKKLFEEKNMQIPEFTDSDDSHGASSLWNTEFGKSKDFHNILDTLQVKLAEKDNLILESKLALHMLKDANFKIWLKADISERAKRAAKRDSISVEEALNLLEHRLSNHKSGWDKVYGLDSLEQEQKADIVIDTTSISPEEVLERILKEMK